MKKINKILIPTLMFTGISTAIAPLISLTSCSKEDPTKRQIEIEKTFFGKVRIAKTEATSSKDLKVTFEDIEPDKITGISKITIGTKELTNAEYKFEGKALTIYNSAFKQHQGAVTIVPVIQEDLSNRYYMIRDGQEVEFTPTVTPKAAALYKDDAAMSEQYGKDVINNPKIFIEDFAYYWAWPDSTAIIKTYSDESWFSISNLKVEIKEIDDVQTPLFSFVAEMSTLYNDKSVTPGRYRCGKLIVKNCPIGLKFTTKTKDKAPTFKIDDANIKKGLEKCGASFSFWGGQADDNLFWTESEENADTVEKFKKLNDKMGRLDLRIYFFAYTNKIPSTYYESATKGE